MESKDEDQKESPQTILDIVYPIPVPLRSVLKMPHEFGKKRKRRRKRVMMTKCLTSEVPDNKIFHRAGIVPYFVDKKTGENQYIFCIDDVYSQITDAGGGINPDEHFLDAAIRELYEETIGIFDFLSFPDKISENSIAYYDRDMILIFQPVEIESHILTCECFRKRYWFMRSKGNAARYLENSFMIWIPESHLRAMCLYPHEIKMSKEQHHLLLPIQKEKKTYPDMYEKVSLFLKVAYSFNEIIAS